VQTFTMPFGAIECEQFHASYEGPATTEALTFQNIEFEGCEFFGPVSVNVGACDQTLYAGEILEEEKSKGSLDTGEESCEIEFTMSWGCTVTIIGGQKGLGTVTHTTTHTGGKKAKPQFIHPSKAFILLGRAKCAGLEKNGLENMKVTSQRLH